MGIIYNDAKDKNVAAYVIYVDENNIACRYSTLEGKMTAAELEDAFIKRALVYTQTSPYDPKAGAYAVPTMLLLHNASIAYATVTAGEAIIYSKEYTAG